MKMYDVAITGGGASGLYLAALLGGRLSAVVIESGARVGSKLSATGGGQGNLTNTGVCADRYFCSDRRLVESVAGSDWRSVLAPFDGLFTADARGRVYPAGRQASALTDCLRRKAEANADIMTETSVLGIKRAADGFLLKTDKGVVRARNAVLCTGGMDMRTVFSGHTGYDLATSLGHSVTALYPAITQLALTDKSLRALKGVRTDCRVRAYGCGEFIAETEGEVIFGDGVVGGSAVYYISSFVTDKRNVKLEFEFLPGVSEEGDRGGCAEKDGARRRARRTARDNSEQPPRQKRSSRARTATRRRSRIRSSISRSVSPARKVFTALRSQKAASRSPR